MNKVTFVSSSDSRYFPLLLEWIHSVRAQPQSAGIDICIMNAGMTPAQIEKIRPLVTVVKDAEWPCPIAEHKIRGREYLKACVARPFIPDYFPGYDTYFWMDADTWIQDWAGVELFLRGAQKKKICLTGQVDRAYPRQVRVKWMGRWPWKVRSFYFSNARQAFGFKTAQKLLPQHVLLAGAFALRADAPHWKRWQELVTEAVKKGKVFTAEQVSLGVMAYIEGYEFELLPAWTHWLCEIKPMVDGATGKFVEPYLPHNTIGILHMSGWDEMRLNRALTTDFKLLAGGAVERSYRYPPFDGSVP
ncbi:MAG: hypothetical protein KKA05_06675 [Alphaproteobacteria bacterium]|nr:hypothetical protein [Alphaproteobacteria bacterium]